MKTKVESSTRTEREKKLNIFRFSIKPTIIKSSILFVLLFLFRSIVVQHFIIRTIVTTESQLILAQKASLLYSILLVLILFLTGIRCLYIGSKKVRIKRGVLMYRYGIIFKHTKMLYRADSRIEMSMTDGWIQRLSNLCTMKIYGVEMKGKKNGKNKRKPFVLKNLKQSDEFCEALCNF